MIVPDVGSFPAMEHEVLLSDRIQEIVNDVIRRLRAYTAGKMARLYS